MCMVQVRDPKNKAEGWVSPTLGYMQITGKHCFCPTPAGSDVVVLTGGLGLHFKHAFG